jgi:hypothetical protein
MPQWAIPRNMIRVLAELFLSNQNQLFNEKDLTSHPVKLKYRQFPANFTQPRQADCDRPGL